MVQGAGGQSWRNRSCSQATTDLQMSPWGQTDRSDTPPQECVGLDTLGNLWDLLPSFAWYRGAAVAALPVLGSIRLPIPAFHFNRSGWHGNGKCS